VPDICDVARVIECIDVGEHDPLQVPGESGPYTWTGYMSQNDVNFGVMHFCKRCGLVYWEPKNPTLEFTVIDQPDE
jgi:hypothetical protein